MVIARAPENSLLLAHRKADDRSNEITAVPQLSEMLEAGRHVISSLASNANGITTTCQGPDSLSTTAPSEAMRALDKSPDLGIIGPNQNQRLRRRGVGEGQPAGRWGQRLEAPLGKSSLKFAPELTGECLGRNQASSLLRMPTVIGAADRSYGLPSVCRGSWLRLAKQGGTAGVVCSRP